MTEVDWSATANVADDGEGPPAGEDWAPVEVPGAPARYAGTERVCYRGRFPDPTDGESDQVSITLRGLFAHGRVWFNGELLGTHDAYFAPARFMAEPAAENELLVECRAPQDRFGGVFDTDLVAPERAVPGIWWGVEVEPFDVAMLGDLSVEPQAGGADESGDTATLVARLPVHAADDVDDRVTFTLRPEGFHGGGSMERASVTVPAGHMTTVEREIEVRDPSHWWPAGLGPQNHYTVRAKLGKQSREVTAGIATVSLDDEAGLTVNGRRMRARGVTVLPGDDPQAAVQRAWEVNANLLRTHAHVPHPDLNRACDEAGILLWQDLPLHGSGGFDIERGRALARALLASRGHHPSSAVYGVHDDPRTPFASGLGSGWLSGLRRRWRNWRSSYDPTPDRAVAEALPDERVVFPVCGPLGIDPDATHLYPGWDYGEASDVDELLAKAPSIGRIVGEFGAGALGTGPVGDESSPGFDAAKHDARAPGDDVARSQAYQADVVRTVAERLRCHGADAMVAYTLLDHGPAGMGLLAAEGEPKAAFEALATAYEPRQALLDGGFEPGERNLVVVNDTRSPVEGTLVWRAGEASGETDVAVGSYECEVVGTATVPADATEATLELTTDEGTVANEYP